METVEDLEAWSGRKPWDDGAAGKCSLANCGSVGIPSHLTHLKKE